jgi:biotin/methionine sulfoxide reductase
VVPWPELVEHTRLLVMFGGAPLKNTQIDPGGAVAHDNPHWFQRAREAGVEMVCVSPYRHDLTDSAATEWLPIRPGTDVALMLGLACTLADEGLADRAFTQSHCTGYDEFERYLTGKADGQPKDARWAAGITGIPADQITRLARRMAATRTVVNTAWAVQRAQYGEQPVWATVALAAMLGQIGLPGGGFSIGFAAINNIALPCPGGIPRPKLPLGPNPVTARVPVGRVHDLLLRPGETLEHNGTEIRLPPTELIYSAGGNPFHHNLDLNRFVTAWQRPGTVVVHEPWWTPPAKFADIVLPSTTTLERNDIAAADNSRFWIAMQQVVPPHAQARNDFDIFAELAGRLGFGPEYHCGRDEMQWLRHMYAEALETARERGFDPPEFDQFWDTGSFEFPLGGEPATLLADFRADPGRFALGTPSGKIELASETIRGFGYDDCPAHPSWLEPAEWLGSPDAARYPLHLLTNQPKHRLHSQLDNSALSRKAKVSGREAILLSPEDAGQRGLRAGDVVRVFNDRGAFLAGVAIADPGTLLPGVAQVPTGAWYDPLEPGVAGTLEKHGNPNVVTSDRGTSRLTQSTAAQTCLVEVERFDDPPPVTAFEWPPLAEGA